MYTTQEEGARPVKAWLAKREDGTLDVEDAALQQTKNISRLPFIAHQGISLMSDAHLGKGATVGSVVPTTNAIIPSAVGVDLGCGMNAVRLSLKASDLPENLRDIRDKIEAAVRLGKGGLCRVQRPNVDSLLSILRNKPQELNAGKTRMLLTKSRPATKT